MARSSTIRGGRRHCECGTPIGDRSWRCNPCAKRLAKEKGEGKAKPK